MKRNILIIICGFIFSYGKAQIVKPVVSFTSPQASSITLFNEIPVSHYNGTASVSIPLYEVKERGINIPVALSYNTSGVRPDQHPGPVGMNWALNAGGMVSRVVKGIPDETYIGSAGPKMGSEQKEIIRYWPDIGGHNYNSYSVPQGYFFYGGVLNTPQWNTIDNILNIATSQVIDATDGNRFSMEAEPDEFYFNFLGYSGKFLVTADGLVKVESNPNLKVNIHVGFIIDSVILKYYPFYQSRDYQFSKHYIITGMDFKTEEGSRYIFGFVDGVSDHFDFDGVELSTDFFKQFYTGILANAWNLTKIISPVNDTVNFYYYHNPYPVANFSRVESYQYSEVYHKSSGFLGWLFGATGETYMNFTPNQYRGSLILPSYLASIQTKNLSVEFDYSPTSELSYDYVQINNSLIYQGGQSFDYYLGATFGYSNNPFNIPPQTFAEGNRIRNLGARFWMYDDVPQQYQTYYFNAYDPNDLRFIEPLNWGLLRWYQLDTIKISNKNNTIKSVNLKYTNNPNQRLRLLSVRETANNVALPPYSFIYDSSFSLPPYLSYRTDHWGFYNNKNSFINNYTPSVLGGYFNLREPDSIYLNAGSLIQINYPTGGYTKLTYEPHHYEKIRQRNEVSGTFNLQNKNGFAGGLRVKEIESFSGYGEPVLKKYFYEEGILNGEPRYYWPVYTGKTNYGTNYNFETFLSESPIPGSTNSAGNYIGYAKVTEFIEGAGKTVFYYSNLSTNQDLNFDSTYNLQRSIYLPFSEKLLERGKIIKKESYSEVGALRQLEEFTYQTSNTAFQDLYTPAIASKKIVLPGMYSYAEFGIEGTAYRVFLYPYDLVQYKSTTYAEGGTMPVTIIKNMKFGNEPYNLLLKEEMTSSSAQNLKNQYKYPVNFPTDSVFSEMVNNHILSPVVEEINFKGSVQQRKTDINYFQPYKGVFVPEYIEEQIASNSPEVTARFHTYDDKGNLLSASKGDDYKTSYLWGYNQTYPITEVKNAQNDVTVSLVPIQKYGSLLLPSGSTYASTTFTTETKGNITITAQSDPGNEFTIQYVLTGSASSSGYLCASRLSQGNCHYPESKVLPDMPAGNYTLAIYHYDGGGYQVASYNYYGIQSVTTGVRNFFHTSFEETEGNSAVGDAKTGNLSRTGGYSTNLADLVPGNYILSYWKKENSVWAYHESEISVTGTAYSINLTGQVDEVRLYPKDARMTTYTYEPLIGMTSMTDENNRTTFYEYDGFGRLRLIKDDNGNIIKRVCYNYAGQPEDCND